jgi:chemotaxis signal transduction protein
VQETVRAARVEQAWRVPARGQDAQEYATFYSGGALFALEAESVREARPASEITPVRIGSPPRAVGLLPVPGAGGREQTLWVFDLGALLTGRPSAITAGSQAVVVAHAGHAIGVLAEELHAVASFDAAQLSHAPLGAAHRLVRGILRGADPEGLIQLLDVATLFRLFETAGECEEAAALVEA